MRDRDENMQPEHATEPAFRLFYSLFLKPCDLYSEPPCHQVTGLLT